MNSDGYALMQSMAEAPSAEMWTMSGIGKEANYGVRAS